MLGVHRRLSSWLTRTVAPSPPTQVACACSRVRLFFVCARLRWAPAAVPSPHTHKMYGLCCLHSPRFLTLPPCSMPSVSCGAGALQSVLAALKGELEVREARDKWMVQMPRTFNPHCSSLPSQCVRARDMPPLPRPSLSPPQRPLEDVDVALAAHASSHAAGVMHLARLVQLVLVAAVQAGRAQVC